MKKVIIGVVAIAIIALVVVGIVMVSGKNKENGGETTNAKMQTTQEMQDTLNGIYTKLGDKLPSIETREIDVTDELAVKAATGLQSTQNVEALVLSEPMMSSQAYSAVFVKTAKGADVEKMKQEMLDNIDTRKWICVTAEKVYVTNHENIIFLVMASEEWAKPVYDEFKSAVDGKVGKELQKTEEI